MATNFRDPRFQRALLTAGSAPRGRQRGLVRKITGEFTDQQTRKDLAFRDMFDRKRSFEANLGLRKRQLAHDDRMFEKNLRSENRGIMITTAAGIGTGILSHLQGKRRAILQREDAEEQRQFRRRMENNQTQESRFNEYLGYSSEF